MSRTASSLGLPKDTMHAIALDEEFASVVTMTPHLGLSPMPKESAGPRPGLLVADELLCGLPSPTPLPVQRNPRPGRAVVDQDDLESSSQVPSLSCGPGPSSPMMGDFPLKG